MIEFVRLRAKMIIVNIKKLKEQKSVQSKKDKFENCTDCLFNDKIILKSQQRLKSDYHNACTEQINKTALISNDDKRLQTFDRITTYPQGTNAFKTCKHEMLRKYK